MTGAAGDGTTLVDEPTAIEGLWQQLVTCALLGTDRRDPPAVTGPIADLVDDALPPAAAQRTLMLVAATTAVRRAAFMPQPAASTLRAPAVDGRPVCAPAAVDRWFHIVASWPVLEDEWMVTLIESGSRAHPRLVPPMLVRHRRDLIGHARAVVASGPLADWLVEHVESLRPAQPHVRDRQHVGADALMTVPALPIPADLDDLRAFDGDHIGSALADGLAEGSLTGAHRPVLINLVARVDPSALTPLAVRLDQVDPLDPAYAVAASLADLARTRAVMLTELSTGATS